MAPLSTPPAIALQTSSLHHPPPLPLAHRIFTIIRKYANIYQVLHPPPHRPPHKQPPNGPTNKQPLPHLLRPLTPQAPSRHHRRTGRARAGFRIAALWICPPCPVRQLQKPIQYWWKWSAERADQLQQQRQVAAAEVISLPCFRQPGPIEGCFSFLHA